MLSEQILEHLNRGFRDFGRRVRLQHRHFVTESSDWLDSAVMAAMLALVVLPPLIMGSVHPWAFIAIELVVFALMVVGVIRIALYPSIVQQFELKELNSMVLPLGLFLALATCQLIPLPPALLHITSPSTYRLYANTLNGWPLTTPCAQLFKHSPSGSIEAGKSTAHKSLANQSSQSEQHMEALGAPEVSPRRPLSIEPELTLEWLLKLLAYAGLFFVVRLYPFGSERNSAQERFYSYVLMAMLISGLVVAGIGILECAFWNGKILWVFVPYDWAYSPLDRFQQASGPFVNHDHFGSYLNLVLPVATAGTLFPTAFVRRDGHAFQVFCAMVTLVISIALMMSLSRAGWLGALVSVSMLVFLASFLPREKRPWLLRLPPRIMVPLCAATALLSLAIISLFLGGEGRHAADLKLKETVNQHDTLRFRINVWRDTLPMVRDYPLFGTGLGAFQDVFPHYQSPPWNRYVVRETHNDYLELLVSAGAIGFCLVAWFLGAIGLRLYSGLRTLPLEKLPVAASMLAAMSAMAFQEFFDFNLQIPANAILFTMILALATRLIVTPPLKKPSAAPSQRCSLLLAGTMAAVAITLSWIASSQKKVPYPYSLRVPGTSAEALSLLVAHPAYSRAHLWLIGRLGSRIALADQTKEFAAAVWLDPTNPTVRDLYARSLVLGGDLSGALKQITLSVFNAPWLDDHYYLTGKSRKMLSPLELAAVEDGLRKAAARNFQNAVWALGSLYDSLGEYAAEGDLYAQTAMRLRDPSQREALLLESAKAHARVGETDEASSELKQASVIKPTDPQPYVGLVELIFSPRNDIAAAKATVKDAITNGANPLVLYLALADAARWSGDKATEESSLTAAVDTDPSNIDAVVRLASLYTREKRFDQAVLTARRGAEIRPDSAIAFDELGLTEEADYQYFAAERDLNRAMSLAPGNRAINAHLQELKRLSASRTSRDMALPTPNAHAFVAQ
jgi:tetratricopeptide (TPR) repeat protein